LGVVDGLGPSSNVKISSGSPDTEDPAAGVGQPLAVAPRATRRSAIAKRKLTTSM
jgi:hypothetical protein